MALMLRTAFDAVEVADVAPLVALVLEGDEPATLEVTAEGVEMRLGEPEVEDAIVLEGEPERVFAFLAAMSDGTEGVSIRGPREATRRLRTLVGRSRLADAASAART